MDRKLTCPQGHRWTGPPDDPDPGTCPVCGATATLAAIDSRSAAIENTTTNHTLVPGYQFVGQAGIGDMAIVFKARDLKRDRFVAVKILRSDEQRAATAGQRFQREVRCLADLNHPNIVKAYESGVSDGVPYLVLEYLEGGNLARKLRGKPMPPREAAQLVETLAGAIEHLHGQGWVHRNLKPHDILYASDGTPKLIDFGLARWVRPAQGSPELKGPPEAEGAVVGTPSYMAPEQAAGETGAIGPTTDVYGLGAVLYECLTARPPFDGPTVADTLQRVREAEPTPPQSLNAEADSEIETVCLRCLEKVARDRYDSARALADDLRRYLEGQPVTARRHGFWGRLLGRP
jgi:serine/threonine-protein kinase